MEDEMVDLLFPNPIVAAPAIIHDNERFSVQWAALNTTKQSIQSFHDRLVIRSVPEGCPGSSDQEHPVVFDSTVDGADADFTEPDLPAETIGPLMQPFVGPFAAGSYELRVTLDSDMGRGDETFICIDVQKSD